ncbi:hypothetical protein [Burkholderia multivorans]|uniref:hypothetical protein n=1 Tax=Burkholderia multivorans TaxID=87883 RepID=UPI000CFF651A|nr:hypothetical protein [Burkholderia multivorans]PRH19120.1 hypothetical protein C6T71_24525 [Burkholderia multivorans]
MTEQEAIELLSIPAKVVIRRFEWLVEASGHIPRNHVFESGVQVGNEVLEGVVIRARYRDVKHVSKGAATFSIPENFSCALFAGHNRIAAFDTNPGQRHSNNVGSGRPYYGQVISAATHRHIWVGDYGYAEPIEPPLLDVTHLIKAFAIECNLVFQGPIDHPLKGQTGTLI